MCHISTGQQAALMNTLCGCGCICPVTVPIDEEIRRLEEHKKILQDRVEMINRKITGLMTVNEP